jgi:hypothetical protein
MAKQFVKDPRYDYNGSYFTHVHDKEHTSSQITITIHIYFVYREGEGIPRFRRPRFIPANDDISEPKLKKQKQDHTVDAGIDCVPVSIHLILEGLHTVISRPPTLSILVNIF